MMQKYKNNKAHVGAYSFSSGLEADVFKQLQLLEAAGEIKDVQVQDHVYIGKAKILMIPDFKYFNIKSNRDEWAEAKGFETDVYRIKRRLWKAEGPGPLYVYKRNRTGIYLHEVLDPK